MRISLPKLLAVLMACCAYNSQPALGQTIQQKLDSLLKEVPKAKEDTNKVLLLAAISAEYYNTDPANGIEYGQLVLDLSEKLNYDYGVVKGNNLIGRCYAVQSNQPEALRYYQAALAKAREMNNPIIIGTLSVALGAIYTSNREFDKAEKYLNEAKAAYDKGSIGNRASLMTNYGFLYAKQGKYKEALSAYLEGIKYEELKKTPTADLAILYSNAGGTYKDLGDHSNALNYLYKAQNIHDAMGNSKSSAFTLSKIASTYIAIVSNKITRIPDSLKNYAQLLDRAEKITARSMTIASDLGILEMKKNNYFNLGNIAELRGDFKEALVFYDKYALLKDSLTGISNEKAFAKIEAEFKVQKMTDSLKYLAALKDTEAKQRETERNGYAIALACAGVIGILLVNRQKLKADQKRKTAEAETQRAEAIAREQLDHFTTSIQEKNELIEKFTAEIKKYQALPCSTEIAENEESLRDLQDSVILTDDQWAKFQSAFDKVYPGYISRAKEKFQGITAAELRFIVLSRLRLNNKEMAAMLGVSHEAIRANKHRLLKKIQLPEGAALEEVVHSV